MRIRIVRRKPKRSSGVLSLFDVKSQGVTVWAEIRPREHTNIPMSEKTLRAARAAMQVLFKDVVEEYVRHSKCAGFDLGRVTLSWIAEPASKFGGMVPVGVLKRALKEER